MLRRNRPNRVSAPHRRKLRRRPSEGGFRIESLEPRSMFASDIALGDFFHHDHDPACGTTADVDHADESAFEFTDTNGRAFAACPAPTRQSVTTAAVPTPAFAEADTFLLHSRPGATKRIYLDFDGHTTVGTWWNSGRTTPIVTPAYDTDGKAGFSSLELAAIQQIWARVAEDFAPFDVDVTTQAPPLGDIVNSGGTDSRWGTRVAIGGSAMDWLGSQGVGGIAYIRSFGHTIDTPAFVFSRAYSVVKDIAEAVSHEVGHTLGLFHDGRTTPNEGYYNGHGDGATSWAPIMGLGYGREVTQWSRGEYAYANNTQDDLDAITKWNGFGYRPDDAGNTGTSARDVGVLGTSATTFAGVIEQNTDVDVFSFSTPGSFRVTVSPASVGANLDILAEIRDGSGTVVATANPTDRLDASFTLTVAAGRYTLSVRGVGFGSSLFNGYSNYASLGQYSVSMTSTDSGTPPKVEVAAIDAAAAETLAGQMANTGVFRFIRTGPTTESLTVPIAVSGSANSGIDYEGLPTTVTFPAGSATALVELRVVDDGVREDDETVTISLVGGSRYTVAGSPATVTIADNDVAALVDTRLKLVGQEPRARRNEVAVFTVALVDADGRPIAGVKIQFKAECRSFGTDSLGTVTTDANGRAVLRYKVPKDPKADNITLSATFAGTTRFGASALKQRLKIG